MKEAQMRDLLAAHPEEFLSERWDLLGTEVNLSGKRADVVFKDQHGRLLIVELQRKTLTRDKSGQLAEYWGRMKQERPNEFIELLLVANNIPAERRLFLEHIGISCKEIPTQKFQEVARKFGADIETEKSTPLSPPVPPPRASQAAALASAKGSYSEPGYYDQAGVQPLNKVFRGACLKIRDMRTGLNKNQTEGIYLVDLVKNCASETRKALILGHLSADMFEDHTIIDSLSSLPEGVLLSMRQREESFDRHRIPPSLGEDFIKVSHRIRGNSGKTAARNLELLHMPLESVIERAMKNLLTHIEFFRV